MKRSMLLVLALVVVVIFISSISTAAEYVVQKGDTLSGISAKLGFSLESLSGLNPDKTLALHPGDKLLYVSQEDRKNACNRWERVLRAQGENESLIDPICGDISLNKTIVLENDCLFFLDRRELSFLIFFMSEEEIKEKLNKNDCLFSK